MSSCLSAGGGGGGGGGGRATAYRLESLDLVMIKSPSISSTTTTTSSWISSSTTASSSESGSPLAIISTRKTRTPRKRPNQTYNEAAALLATAYPKIFPPTTTHNNFTKPSFSFEPTSDLLVDTTSAAGFLLHRPNCSGPTSHYQKAAGRSPSDKCGELDFDAESIILGGEVLGEGIDCIMGDFSTNYDDDGNGGSMGMEMEGGFCYGYPVGLGFEIGEIGIRKEMRAIRNGEEEGDWWRFPTVDSPEKRRTKKVEFRDLETTTKTEDDDDDDDDDFVVPRLSAELLLKLNHDAVLEAWSNKASPFSDDVVTVAGRDVQARLAQIDLFGGMREASLLRYKEKRRNRLFSKRIRYQVRKVNADRRPRMKGRFVRTQNSNSSDD